MNGRGGALGESRGRGYASSSRGCCCSRASKGDLRLEARVAVGRIERALDDGVQEAVGFEPEAPKVEGAGAGLDRGLPAAVMLLDHDLEPLEPLERIAGRQEFRLLTGRKYRSAPVSIIRW